MDADNRITTNPLTGEPDAGDPPVRFGGRGKVQSLVPTPIVVENEGHFLFNTPEKSGLKNGEKFGWGGEGKFPMANGHETDIRPSTFAALQTESSPEDGVVPRDPAGITRIANGILPWSQGG